MPTVAIALIREHAEKMRPPRALWVPFELGRPLGAPNDPAFQHRVLEAALSLFAAEYGPVLADYPEEAPESGPTEEEIEGLACPVSFSPPPSDRALTLAECVRDESARLRLWYDLARERTGRSTFGTSGLTTEEIVNFLDDFVVRGAAIENPISGQSLAATLKLVTDDLAAFYYEAASARPDTRNSSRQLLRWFWTETHAAKLLLRVRDVGAAANDEQICFVAQRLLVPRAAQALI